MNLKLDWNKALTLLGVFLICFSVAYMIKGALPQRNEPGEPVTQYVPESYDLQSSPLVDLEDISILDRIDQERTHLIQSVIPSVVCISTEGIQRRQFNVTGQSSYESVKGEGSGVIVSKQGHVVTNHHVISGKSRFMVAMHDGREYAARLIGTDPSLDVAVLRIDAPGVEFSPMPFGNSDLVRVGQTVFALGNPFGLGETVTQGIVSAKERSFSDSQRDLFQTDAAINPGNSGGPLVNLKGEIIGINVAIFSSDKDSPGSQGVGFSIPANEVLRSFKQIAERGRPIKAYLGVKMMDLSPDVRAYLGYNGAGVAITEVVKDSPAEKAGVLPRDVITSYGGMKVEGLRHMIRLIRTSPVDKEVAVELSRGGQMMKMKVMVEDSETVKASSESIKDSGYREVMARVAAIGLKVRALEWIEKRVGGEEGVIVSGIQQGSMASNFGLKPNDRVVSMNNEPLYSPEQFYRYLVQAKKGEQMTMVVQRNTQRVELRFSLK